MSRFHISVAASMVLLAGLLTGAAASPAASAAPYVPPSSGLAGRSVLVSPARILDTRIGNGVPVGAVGPRQTIPLQITGRGGVPAGGVSTVFLNVTATAATAGGYITAWPDTFMRPMASALNFADATLRCPTW
jgi:hypothetical protein